VSCAPGGLQIHINILFFEACMFVGRACTTPIVKFVCKTWTVMTSPFDLETGACRWLFGKTLQIDNLLSQKGR